MLAGRYELGDKLGEGGMGSVYIAKDHNTNRLVAVKQMKPDLMDSNPELIERFRREAEALRRLNHPNIVRVSGLINEDNALYIIMEYVPGGTLQSLIHRQGALPLNRVLAIGLEISDALARAHHLNIIHRDIKSANILIAKDGTPRLTDFGIAHIGDRSRVTQTNMLMGTLAYLSPEALDSAQMDTRSDIWAFGILLYEMLTGELPFVGSVSGATIASILNKPLPDMSDLRDDIPSALKNLITRMLQKDPDKRIASARLVGAEIYAIMKGTQSPLQGMPQQADTEAYSGVIPTLITDLLTLTQDLDKHATEAETYLDQSSTVDMQTFYYKRGVAEAYRNVLSVLNTMLSDSQEIMAELGSTSQPPGYIEVTQDEVARLFRQAKIKIKSLYEDQGHIFSVIFPKLLSIPLEERVKQVQNLASGVTILESGKLPDTGESYVDFAFTASLRSI